MKQQQQQRFRLDMKKFPTVCARRSSSKCCDPRGCRNIFPSRRWFGKKRRQPGFCGLASLQPGSETGSGPRATASLMSAVCHCCFKSSVAPSCFCSRKAKILLGGPDSLGTCVLWPPRFYQELQPCSVSGLEQILWCHRAFAHAVSFGVLCVIHSLYTVSAQCWLCGCVHSRGGEDSCGAGLCLRINRPGFEPHNCRLPQAARTFPHLTLLQPAPV